MTLEVCTSLHVTNIQQIDQIWDFYQRPVFLLNWMMNGRHRSAVNVGEKININIIDQNA